MKCKISPNHQESTDFITKCIVNFDNSGQDFIIGNRNSIKIFKNDGFIYNIKSFKKPNIFNQIIYRFFRASKAKRSFDYASILIEKNIGTPEPIAYFENYNFFGLTKSFYVCQHIIADLTFTNLNTTPTFPDHEEILRGFTKFSYQLHENGIEFLDHSQGNTLIKRNQNSTYSMNLDLRMKNLCRLTPKRYMIEIMSQEYAKLSGISYEIVLEKMWFYVQQFQEKFEKKHADITYKGND